MNIGIIGAGAMAQTLAYHINRAGHDVMLSNSRGPESLVSIGQALKCRTGTVLQAAQFGDIVALAIPLWAFSAIDPAPFENKIVLDLLNYFPHRDGKIEILDRGETTTSEMVAKHFVGAKLIKAFNAITVDDLYRDPRPRGHQIRRALPIAGDDKTAKEQASLFINDVGFDVVDVGPLADGWKIERFRPAYCVAMDKETLFRTLADTSRGTRVPDGYWLKHRPITLV
ncbi:NAD(P)-binding domain-containing protein [Rhizobium lemnae]|uniref:NADPH-dependent F420 reductase n=1 Tax=Rhizobium lemnae TaxID=1214924 RepID=A0ABV8ECT8_9HYPH|nr:NAD(P)-binding domain-containing protein [Rhizobium lemnae]MCJ8507161.1 NAD(P)-binding domain-containing protein [Rhizobium lemnae]